MWLMLSIFIVSLLFCILANIYYYRSLATKGEDNVWLLKDIDFIVISMFLSSSIFLKDVFLSSEQIFSIQHLLCFIIGYALSISINCIIRNASKKKWGDKKSKTVVIRHRPDRKNKN